MMGREFSPMQFKKDILSQIAAHRVTVAFRRWRKPSVRAGDILTTTAGNLSVAAVERVAISKIPDTDLKRAGYPTRAALLKELAKHPGGDVYRIAFRLKPVETRKASKPAQKPAANEAAPLMRPIETRITKTEIRTALSALRTLDQGGEHGPWTSTTLRLIEKYPARRGPDLAASQRRDPIAFQRDVIRLRQLGLTENLEIGYRLSPRGRAVLAELDAAVPHIPVSAPKFTPPALPPRRLIPARAFAPARQN
jgi:hypothetical protein